jgi:hypothetical protein
MADRVVCPHTGRSSELFKCEYEGVRPGVWRIVYTILKGTPASKKAFWRPTGRWRNNI